MKKNANRGTKREATRIVQLVLPTPEALRGTLNDLVVGAGLAALVAMLEVDREEACGPRYRHDAGRAASRTGHADGELSLGGRRVRVRRPRVRTTDGHEVTLPTWKALAGNDPLRGRAVEQMLVGVSTRKYERSLEPMPPGVVSRGTSRSAVSRRFVEATQARIDEMVSRDLGALSLVAVMIDGLNVGEHTVLIALGIDEQGEKHVLGLREGATENSAACTALLAQLRDRGLRTDRTLLFVIDGSKALRKSVRDVFGNRALVQRCQVHKVRNVEEHLPERERARVTAVMRGAYRSQDLRHAKRVLEGLARQLERRHPSAAESIREGLDETLTVLGLGLTDSLLRTLATTNPIENLNGLVRYRIRRVRRWDGGAMVLRWLVASLDDAAKGFRRLRGHKQIPKLLAALRAHDAKLDKGVDRLGKAA